MSAALQRVAIHGAPRSGTSWLGEIFNSSPRTIFKYQPLFSYALKGYLSPDSTAEEIDEFFHLLETTADDFMDQVERRAGGALPTFTKEPPTHIVYKEVRYHHILANLLQCDESLRLVAIVRNPLAVLASWLQAPREFRKDLGWREEDEWRNAQSKNLDRPEEFYGYERWKVSARIFLGLAERHPERVRVVSYGELLAQPMGTVRSLFEFCGLPISQQTRDFLLRQSDDDHPDPYSVFRAAAGDRKWEASLDARIVQAVGTDLAGSDLDRFMRIDPPATQAPHHRVGNP